MTRQNVCFFSIERKKNKRKKEMECLLRIYIHKEMTDTLMTEVADLRNTSSRFTLQQVMMAY
jgi:hypothetical protein